MLPHDPGTPPRTSWCIHVVGTDAVEGDTVDTTVAVFAPLCALLLKDFNVLGCDLGFDFSFRF